MIWSSDWTIPRWLNTICICGAVYHLMVDKYWALLAFGIVHTAYDMIEAVGGWTTTDDDKDVKHET